MPMMTNTQRLPFGAITVHRIVSAFSALVETVQARLAARRTARILSRLSPEQLDDIGLIPGDIERIASGRF